MSLCLFWVAFGDRLGGRKLIKSIRIQTHASLPFPVDGMLLLSSPMSCDNTRDGGTFSLRDKTVWGVSTPKCQTRLSLSPLRLCRPLDCEIKSQIWYRQSQSSQELPSGCCVWNFPNSEMKNPCFLWYRLENVFSGPPLTDVSQSLSCKRVAVSRH